MPSKPPPPATWRRALPAAASGGDELNDLGRDFDRMSGRLRALMDGQRRLLHDVSHELRSPLARLQAAIGLAHQQPDRIATSLERIERESVRMDKLVGELLTLSRLEADPNLPKDELVDMQELVDGIASDVRFEVGDDGPAIEVGDRRRAASAMAVRGAPDLLWRAIENVVRNAVKHGGAGGVVAFNLRADAQCGAYRRARPRTRASRRPTCRPSSSPSSARIRRRTMSTAMAWAWRSRSASFTRMAGRSGR